MLKKKIVLPIVSSLVILFSSVNVQASPARYENKKVNGKNVNVVTIDLNQNVGFKVVTANDKAIGSENIKSMINRNKPIAAINGNYFDAYKTLEPIGPIVKDGVMVNLGGDNASFFVDNYNRPDVQSLYLEPDGVTTDLEGKEYVFPIGLANIKPRTSGAHIYNSNFGSSVTVSQGGAITVVNNVITNIDKNPKTISIPKNGYVIYFGDGIKEGKFKVGNEFKLRQKYFSDVFSKYAGTDKYENAKIEQLVAAGPLLVQNGKNVVSENLGGFSEAKIVSQRAQRSAIGVTKDNRVIMATQSSSNVNELANIMISLGCDSATNLDGGASSALYANGKYITNPGRKLNSMVMVVNNPKPVIEEKVVIHVNGNRLDIPAEFGQAYLDENKNTMVPLRFISEYLGHSMEWQESTGSTIINNSIEVFPNSNKASLNGNEISLNSKVIVSNGRTYVPLRFMSESLGHEVDYKRLEDKANHKVFHNIYIK